MRGFSVYFHYSRNINRTIYGENALFVKSHDAFHSGTLGGDIEPKQSLLEEV